MAAPSPKSTLTNSQVAAPRAPAAPPPRPLGRPLSARPTWEDTAASVSEGPLPRVVAALLIVFVIARLVTNGAVPFVAALIAGGVVYGMALWRR